MPDGQDAASRKPSRVNSSQVPVTRSPSNSQASPLQYEGLNQQSRRLQLRNAGFRGPLLPARHISPIFRSQSFSEPLGGVVNNENSGLSPDRRTLYGEDMPPSPVNILQEIHNSSKGRKRSPRPKLSNIFQDHSSIESSSSLGGRSWYNESSNSSPPSFKTSPINMMKLREGSLNQKAPLPQSTPRAKQMKGRNVGRVNSRSTSFEASKYIEHLESQLTALNAKVDTLVSPNSSKARAAKLRAITIEARSLRHELADWEKNFAERVKEGIEQGLEMEAGLKGRIQTAEDEVRLKASRINELEFENEKLRSKLKDTESLEITNANLEKRVDVLTSLLVQSPTKLEFGSATSSPSKGFKVESQKRTPRPRSTLSPSGGVRLSLSTIGESTFWNSKAQRSDSHCSESPDRLDNHFDEDSTQSPERVYGSQQMGVFDDDSGNSSSQHSVPSSSSRPTSLHSCSSFGPPSWGLPLAGDRDSHARYAHRQRRMRRFPSGSGTLKPLILPSATGTPSLPASAPVGQPSDTFKRDISNFSLDPTIAFLSREEQSSPTQTPTQPKRNRSSKWAQDEALRLLEGRPGSPEESHEDGSCLSTASPSVEEHVMQAIRESSRERDGKSTRPRSLEEELKHAFLNMSGSSCDDASFQDGLIPVNEESKPLEKCPTTNGLSPVLTNSKSTLVGLEERSSFSASRLRQRHISPSSEYTPKPPKLPTLMASPPKSPPSTTVVSHNVSGLCTRLANMITRTSQDPVVLAQRLLYNAWTLGSGRLGGIGWWLLGVLFGFRSGKGKRKTDEVTGEAQPKVWFDWRPYSAVASRQRTAQCFLKHSIRGMGRVTTPVGTPRNAVVEPHIFPCKNCEEPSLRRTLRLWFQFSLTIVLAVGIAIKYGPGTLLPPLPPPTPPSYAPCSVLDPADVVPAKSEQTDSPIPAKLRTMKQLPKPLMFAQILGPEDFEGRVSAPETNHHRPS